MSSPDDSLIPDHHKLLRERFGFEEFRPGQESAIQQLLQGKSVLAIFPTGAGKSLCYQLPALLLEGITVVVSPLIALMKDQVDFLKENEIPAARLDSTLTEDETRKIMQALTSEEIKILYVAPERLVSEHFLHLLKRLRVNLLAIDEAHCISEWGHNFRPDYLKLGQLVKAFQIPRVLALTATATPQVEKDIAREFTIDQQGIVHTGFYRPNLELHVTPCHDQEKFDLLQQRILSRTRGSTIVYVTIQKMAEEVASRLCAHGIFARHYHAGMEPAERHQVQEWFMTEPEAVVVATIAFGMGIDKANIRSIYHYNLPKSLENYSQEIGRAGRDGEHAVCELFATAGDRLILENFIYGDTPSPGDIRAVLIKLFRLPQEFDVSLREISNECDIRILVLTTLLTYLELEGVLKSTGSFYEEYEFQPRRSSRDILKGFDSSRQEFLRKLFQQASKSSTWHRLKIDWVAEKLKEPRQRIVAALTYLHERGEIELKAKRQRHRFRREKLTQEAGLQLCERLAQQFLSREKRDIARLHAVLDYAVTPGCLTSYVLRYFGDKSVNDCGHCGRCKGEPAKPLPPEDQIPFTPSDDRMLMEIRDKNFAALRTPRQLTRFFCGLTSPAVAREKLKQDRRFGTLGDRPFLEVLQWIEEQFHTG
ncbi:MAG: ATP-dependent DNA helicase RecQ [Gemmataceae bacterium]